MRALVEGACGLLAVAMLISFHSQISRLEQRQEQVTALEQRLDDVTRSVHDRSAIDSMQRQILRETETRLASLRDELQSATADSAQARDLEAQVTQTKQELQRLRSEMSSDFAAQKEYVNAYIRSASSKDQEQDAALRRSSSQSDLASLASCIWRDPRKLTHEMLLPTVQLNGDDTVGSGTLVFSDINPKTKKLESYLLTSYHVVRNILTDTPRARSEGFDVTIYLADERLVVKGKMVASKPAIDAALVRVLTDRKLPNVANVLPRADLDRVAVWDPVCAVGCPLGNDPVPTQGEVASLRNELNGTNYWMINAPTYFGNSGGGVYLDDTRQLIGVFSKIYTHGKSTPVVVPHMGLCTPISLVYDWLTEEKLDHLLTSRSVAPPDIARLAAEGAGAATTALAAPPK